MVPHPRAAPQAAPAWPQLQAGGAQVPLPAAASPAAPTPPPGAGALHGRDVSTPASNLRVVRLGNPVVVARESPGLAPAQRQPPGAMPSFQRMQHQQQAAPAAALQERDAPAGLAAGVGQVRGAQRRLTAGGDGDGASYKQQEEARSPRCGVCACLHACMCACVILIMHATALGGCPCSHVHATPLGGCRIGACATVCTAWRAPRPSGHLQKASARGLAGLSAPPTHPFPLPV